MAAGVFVPLITPIDSAGDVCRASVGRLIQTLRHSAAGFVPCLTSGEGWRLTERQWSAMLEHTLAHAGGAAVVVGIERPSTTEVLAYAERAIRLGAAGVMLTSPFGEAIHQDVIFRHFEQVHDAVDGDIYIYNESSLSGNETHFETLLAIGGLRRVVGVKDSANRPRDVSEIAALRARGVSYYLGWEHHLGSALSADGCVVSLANIEPTLCRLALTCANDQINSEIGRLTEAYSLLSEDWYAHIKAELFKRGVISTPKTVGS